MRRRAPARGGRGLSALWSYAGAALLVAATIPQALRLARTRDATGLTWGFVALNATGIALLGARSAELGEWSFVAANAATAAFWLLAAAVKTQAALAKRGARSAGVEI